MSHALVPHVAPPPRARTTDHAVHSESATLTGHSRWGVLACFLATIACTERPTGPAEPTADVYIMHLYDGKPLPYSDFPKRVLGGRIDLWSDGRFDFEFDGGRIGGGVYETRGDTVSLIRDDPATVTFDFLLQDQTLSPVGQEQTIYFHEDLEIPLELRYDTYRLDSCNGEPVKPILTTCLGGRVWLWQSGRHDFLEVGVGGYSRNRMGTFELAGDSITLFQGQTVFPGTLRRDSLVLHRPESSSYPRLFLLEP